MNPYLNELAPRGSFLFYSLMFLPQNEKEKILAIHGFYKEIMHVHRKCQTKEMAEQKLNYWEQEIENMYRQIPNHPITQTLFPWIEKNEIGIDLWKNQIDESRLQLVLPRIATFEDFILHAHHSTSLREILIAKLLKIDHPKMLPFFRDSALFLRIAEIISELRLDINRDILLIPQSLLTEFSVDESDFYTKKTTPNIEKLLAFLHQQGLKALDFFWEKPKASTAALETLKLEEFFNFSQKEYQDFKIKLKPQLLYLQFQKQLLKIIADDNYHTLEKHYHIPAIRLFFKACFFQ